MKTNYLNQITIISLGLSLLLSNAYASSLNVNAATGSTQYVTVMNSLANPSNSARSQTPVLIKFFDGQGSKTACWSYTYKYHNEIATGTVAGAGGNNGCGAYTTPPAIVKLQLIPQKTVINDQAYDPTPLDVTLVDDPSARSTVNFYYVIYLEQAVAPKVDPNTGALHDGKMKAIVCMSDPLKCTTVSQ